MQVLKQAEIKQPLKQEALDKKAYESFYANYVLPGLKQTFPALKGVLNTAPRELTPRNAVLEYEYKMSIPTLLSDAFDDMHLNVNMLEAQTREGNALWGIVQIGYHHPGGGSNGVNIGSWGVHQNKFYVRKEGASGPAYTKPLMPGALL